MTTKREESQLAKLKRNIKMILKGPKYKTLAMKRLEAKTGGKTGRRMIVSRQRLHEAKERFKATDKKIGKRLKTIDKLHKARVKTTTRTRAIEKSLKAKGGLTQAEIDKLRGKK